MYTVKCPNTDSLKLIRTYIHTYVVCTYIHDLALRIRISLSYAYSECENVRNKNC